MNNNEYDGMPIEYLIETARMDLNILNNDFTIEQIVDVICAEPSLLKYLNKNNAFAAALKITNNIKADSKTIRNTCVK